MLFDAYVALPAAEGEATPDPSVAKLFGAGGTAYASGGTIDIAIGLQPNARRILVISGASPLDLELAQRAGQIVPTRVGTANVEFLSGVPLAELVARVSAEPKDTIVLYLTQFRDRDGRPP